MSDIDITFATNAGTVASQVDRVAASTTKASTAQKSHASVTNQEAQSLKLAAAAAREKAAADRQSELAATKAAAADRQRFQRGASFLGLSRGAGGASALLGAGAGIGQFAAATAAFTGVGLGLTLLTAMIEKWINSTSEQSQKMSDLTKSMEEASRNVDKSGLTAAREYGSSLKSLAFMGGDSRELLQQFGPKHGLKDTVEAIKVAKLNFGENYVAVLEEASTAAELLGEKLSSMVGDSKGMTWKTFTDQPFGTAAAALATMHGYGNISQPELVRRAGNMERQTQFQDLRLIAANDFSSEQVLTGNIGKGVRQSFLDPMGIWGK